MGGHRAAHTPARCPYEWECAWIACKASRARLKRLRDAARRLRSITRCRRIWPSGMLQREVLTTVGHDPRTAPVERAPEPLPRAPTCPFPMDVDTGLPTDLVAPTVSSPPARAPVQCAWAVCLDTRDGLQYLYVDPCASLELASVAPKLQHRSLVDFVAPEERPRMLTQLRTMAQTRTLFGSVIRCRYASMASIRAELHGWAPIHYVVTDLVVNRLGPHLALCFFHQVGADEMASVCGMPPGMLSLAEVHRLWHELYGAAPEAEKEPVSYVFQVLSTVSPRQLLSSWPPPTLYDACALAKLVQQATIKPEATCTERLHATHTLPMAGHTRSVESVLVPCGSIVLACFFVRPLNLDEARPAPRRASPVNEVEPAASPIRAVAQAAPAPSLPSSTSVPPQAQPIAPHDSHKEEAPAQLAVPTVTTPSWTKSCTSCGRSDSPEWRRGPSGHKTVRTSL